MLFQIKMITDKSEKINFIKVCDIAFPRGISVRKNSCEIINKINEYAFFYGAYAHENYLPIGYIAFYANDINSLSAHISMIGVLSEYQGEGIGKALFKACVDKSLMNGMRFLRLEVDKSNKKAIEFYEHMGLDFESEASNDSYYMKMTIGKK